MRKIRMGMVGGGEGAFIGAIHRIAANISGDIELVCGAFSRDVEKSKRSGKALYLPESRSYGSYLEMMTCEAALPPTERMDFVAIVTPNHLHYPIARAAMEAGFHVMSDKPATFSLEEALSLKDIINQTQKKYGLTHTYTGYPMVKEARALVADGLLGNIRKVVVEYTQGWLASADNEAGKQAAWRLDPKQSGASCCMGDIGVHAANLAEYITQSHITHLCADLGSLVEGRTLDDDGTALLRFHSGARGVLMASQISVGEENALRIRIYGEKAGLEWNQQEPNTLWVKYNDKPTEMRRVGVGGHTQMTQHSIRTPAGHPEGYLEAFANIYRNFAAQITAEIEDKAPPHYAADCPGIDDAIRGMAFIEYCVKANNSSHKWVEIPTF